MAGRSISFNTVDYYTTHLETLARWLSCNGEAWGVGPTIVFASAAALFLYNELQSTFFVAGDNIVQISVLERSLVTTMVLGLLALMVHLWVCSMRFFQYYLDTLVKESPNILLEMTTGSLLAGHPEIAALGPLTKFLRQQQPQIHITICWFLSLCYADYVRKHYCQRFNMPYLEQWQAELHERASRGVHNTVAKVTSYVEAVQQKLRGFTRTADQGSRRFDVQTEREVGSSTCDVCDNIMGVTSISAASLNSKQTGIRRPEFCFRMLSQASEVELSAVEKLRAYIQATRCNCQGPECGAGPSPEPNVPQITTELKADRFLAQP